MSSPFPSVEPQSAVPLPVLLDAADVQRLLGLPSRQSAYRVLRERQCAGVTVLGGRRRRVVSAIFTAWLAAGAPRDVATFEREHRRRSKSPQPAKP